MKEIRIGIYYIKNLKDGKLYIGQSIDMIKEWNGKHRTLLNHNKHWNKYLQNAWNKYGEENFEHVIICECLIDELDDLEYFYINEYNSHWTKSGYNMSLGGEAPMRGMKHSQESKDKMSLSRMGNKNGLGSKSWFGKNHTQESKDKISQAKIGKPSWNKGLKMKEETKEKLSESRRGIKKEGATSKYMGVHFENGRNRWMAAIRENRKVKNLGYFKLEIDAAKAYDKKCYELYRDKAKLNFPEDYNL